MSEFTLAERCKVNTNRSTDTFVGIKAVNGDISINFPLGFRLSLDEKELRKDILLLLRVLSKNTENEDSELNSSISYNEVSLPIQAYLFIIADYYTRGYYKEREHSYEVAKGGKINWNKTIKTQKVYIQENEAYYLKFVTKKNSIKDDELITLIHQYCVYESFNKLGWLFTSFVPERPSVKYNKQLFLSTIKRKYNDTFNDRNKQLFKNLLAIIMSLGDEGTVTEYKYGTYRFEYVWETLIDKAYGIQNKANYFPKTRWIIDSKEYVNASLEPDTIMLFNNKVYVLDGKYYKYGETGNPYNLPASTSINKQITYGEYIAENNLFKDEDGSNPIVYNAFLMPYNAYGEIFHTEKYLHFAGTAISDWKNKDGLKSYESIAGILVDVKSLMEDYTHSEDKINELASLIENKINSI